MAVDSLTDERRAMLDLEARWFPTAASKEDAIRDLGMTPTRYYQLIAQVIGTEAALAYSPMAVNRLLRISRPRSAGSPRRPTTTAL